MDLLRDVDGDQLPLPALGRDAAVPIHTQISQWLGDLVTHGVLAAGDRLPRERDLSQQLGVSRMTLRQALDDLERRGLIERRLGRTGGTFVTEPRVDCDLTGLPGFAAQVRRKDMTPHSRVIKARRRKAPRAVINALRLTPGSEVYELVRVRLANHRPVVVERSFFPLGPLPRLLEQDLSGSIYEVLGGLGQPPHSALEELEPVLATSSDSRLLTIAEGTPLMRITRTAFTAADVPIEYSADVFRTDIARIFVRSQVGLDAQTANGFDVRVQT
ncbi:GntR family transcriptional regulator [Cumulibacter manganitolerans]|uniref:GntR family transcriptional regulator n=1 Tax=Cumulibacter manganitolerans TaxID=1884992 RepID=UPI0012977070|nr:GntR family transcriptional regulator [Cumulibacter manganitolerans]